MAVMVNVPSGSKVTYADNDLDLTSKLRNYFTIARNNKRVRYDHWRRNYHLVNNRMGSASTMTSSWAPAPRDSEIYPTISALVGWMTDQDTFVDITPAADPSSPYYDWASKVSNDLAAVIFSTWLTEDYNAQIKLGLWDAFQFGIGIYKSIWDNGVSGGYGNALLRRVDPWSFYPDPNATSMYDGEYFCEVRRMSYDELERRFPDTYSKVHDGGAIAQIDERPSLYNDQVNAPKANPGALPGGQVRWSMPRTSNMAYEPQPGVVVYEFWLRENSSWRDDNSNPDVPVTGEQHIEDKWRVVSIANNVVLLDEMAEDLWSHKSHPYERYVFDDIGEFYGISLVDHLAHPQIYINRLLTALQQNAELTGNPIFLEQANTGLDRTSIINRPGQRLRLSGAQAMANAPHWLEPPPMSSEVSELVQFWISRMENVSGLSAIVRGATPTARNAEGVISSIQEAAFVRIRSALRNLEKTLERSTCKIADLIIDNYTEPRYVAIIGPDGSQSSLALKSRHFDVPTAKGATPLKYTLTVQAGAATPTSRQARVAEADKLFAMGAIDDEAVIEAHQYPHGQEIIKRKYDKMAAGVFAPPGARQRTR